jgi:acyl-CoA thioesterase II
MPEQETSTQLAKLLKLLNLDRLDQDLFLGDPGRGEGRLFGGLVAAQCVMAAYRTVEEGSIHSLHAYFLRPGSYEAPIRYVVYRIRDGKTFTTRDIVAYQAGEAIFQMSCSFTKPEEGVTSQLPMPEAPPPEGLPEWDVVRPDREQRQWMNRWRRERPVELRFVGPLEQPETGPVPPRRMWLKPRGILPEDPALHAAVIAYSTDMTLMSTAYWSHRIVHIFNQALTASLDHTVWFHYPPRFDDWLLFTSDSPITNAARALVHATLHRADGTHVVSVAQEGLIRRPRPGAAMAPPPPTPQK